MYYDDAVHDDAVEPRADGSGEPHASTAGASNDDVENGAIRMEYGGSRRPSTAVVEAVAAATGRDPLALPPLFGVVDPDAVDGVLAPTSDGRTVRLTFEYDGVDVIADGDGWIEAHPNRA